MARRIIRRGMYMMMNECSVPAPQSWSYSVDPFTSLAGLIGPKWKKPH